MEIETKFRKGTCLMSMAGELNIYFAGEVKPVLLDIVAKCDEAKINLAGVTEIDSAGVQLLLLLRREMVTREKTLCLCEQSHAVLEVMELYNLAAAFAAAPDAASDGRMDISGGAAHE
jgi:anti-sigma B factor antagonist